MTPVAHRRDNTDRADLQAGNELMRGRRALAAATATLLLCAQGVQAQAPAAGQGQVLTFTDEVPCPPGAAAAPRVRHVRHRIHRARPAVHKVALHKVVPPLHRPPHRVLVRHPIHRRRPMLVRAAAPVTPTRCSVLRRERLTTASFALAPELAELTPIVEDVAPGGPALASLTSGRPALPNIVNPTGGGGGVSSVSAAPEPEGWLLLLSGVGALGFTLRRRRWAKVS